MPQRLRTTNEPLFVTWKKGDEKGKREALSNASSEYGVIVQRESTHASSLFTNVQNNVSVRDGMNRRDWEYFRPEESIPRQMKANMAASMVAYRRVGIVKRIIDLMGEFTCQGIRLVHQQPNIEKLYQEWAKKIDLSERAERFCNYLYRLCNVIVQRETAIVRETDLENLRQGFAQEDIVQRIDPPPKIRKGEIPWGYTFLNPIALDLMGGDDLAQFAGVAIYGFTIPDKIYNKIKAPKTPEEQYIVAQLPEYIVKSVRNGIKIIPLDPAQVQAFFYKKDDWQIWADPLIYSVMDDLVLYNKLRLADLAALDGAISHIRLWRLGSLEHEIAPTPAAMARLADILVNNTSVGAIDLIWGPELDLKETSTDVYKFLGSEKYSQCIQNIYDGMGVPYTLRGTGGKGGMSSFLSLKVLMEQLKHGRAVLNSFLEPEIRLFQRALGLRFPAEIQYDYMILDDPNAFLRLLIELVDRDLLSVESVQEAFGNIPEIERIRIKREHQGRQTGKMRPKAGPYHSAQTESELLKIFAQTGIVTPSEAGVELAERESSEKSMMEMKIKAQKDAAAMRPKPGNPFGKSGSKPKGKSGQGRPAGKRDTVVRKQRALKPTKAVDFFTTRAWAKSAQNTISEVVTPLYLEYCDKKNVRSLTEEEFKNLENLRFALLCNLEPYAEFSVDALAEPLPIPDVVSDLMTATLTRFTEKFNRPPTIDEVRMFQVEVYSLFIQSEAEAEEVYEDVVEQDYLNFIEMDKQ